MNTGKFIKEARIKAGISQQVIAKAFGYSTIQFVSNWERNVSIPPKKIIRPLAKLLKVKMQDLAQAIVSDKQAKVTKEYLKYL